MCYEFIIGFILFLLVIITYFRKIFRQRNLNLWAWFVFLPLVINFTETTFFRVGHITNVFIMLGYLLMFTPILDKSNSNSN